MPFIDFLIMFLPNAPKIAAMRARGAKIGRGCRIGLSLIDAKRIEIGDCVYIGHFNLIHRVQDLRLGSGSRMNNFNWVTGARTGSFSVGTNSAITRLHFFEASASITIDHDTIIAGRASHFFTHGISSTDLDSLRPIDIGPWCYVGSSSRFVPGSGLALGTFVGMGSVVTRRFTDEYVLLGGAPARILKKLSSSDIYFSRSHLPHDHHSAEYAASLK